jgi:hypothetical protein
MSKIINLLDLIPIAKSSTPELQKSVTVFLKSLNVDPLGKTKIDNISGALDDIISEISSIPRGLDEKGLKSEVMHLGHNIDKLDNLLKELDDFEQVFRSHVYTLMGSGMNSFKDARQLMDDYVKNIKNTKKNILIKKQELYTRKDSALKNIKIEGESALKEMRAKKDKSFAGSLKTKTREKAVEAIVINLFKPNFWIGLSVAAAVGYYLYNNWSYIINLFSYNEKEELRKAFEEFKNSILISSKSLEGIDFDSEADPEAYNLITSLKNELTDASGLENTKDMFAYFGIINHKINMVMDPEMQARIIAISSDKNKIKDFFATLPSTQVSIKRLSDLLSKVKIPDSSERNSAQSAGGKGSRTSIMDRGERSPNDKGIDVLGNKIYLSEFVNLDYATRSAAPVLINNVLLSPTGLSFWDPEGRSGGGYFKKSGPIENQVIEHIRFFLNPRSIDRTWQYGVIDSERKLKLFIKKNLPQVARQRGSEFRESQKEYKKKRKEQSSGQQPELYFGTKKSSNILEYKKSTNLINKDADILNDKNIKNILSTNTLDYSERNMNKKADKFSKEYYQDALKDLDDQYAKIYYAGLKSMYDEKLGTEKADYKMLYEPLDGKGSDLLEKAYPNSVYVADAMGNGGLVENSSEQKRHNVGVAMSIPTGNYRGKYSNLVSELIKIANTADLANLTSDSDLIEKAAADIVRILKS